MADIRRALAVLREVPQFAIELFVAGKEDGLADTQLLRDVGGSSLFMLLKLVSDRLALEALFKNTHGEG